jgi:AraC-like DNA-binding protein
MRIRSSENSCVERELDPVAEVLQDFRLAGSFYCRSELRAPWGVEISGRFGAGFHFVAKGNCYLRYGGGEPLRLEEGELVVLPHGGNYILSDSPNGEVMPAESLSKEVIGPNAKLLRHGGEGELTILVGGGVRFEDPGLHPLVTLMPDVIHVRRTDCEQDEMLRAMVAAMSTEAHSPRPGGATLMTRLADVLVIQAVRGWLDHSAEGCSCWLTALRDPKIGKALALIHRRPEERWTVGGLAKAVHLSRSVFSARFTELVRTPPMQYLTQWRMHLAARWLREERLAIREVAARFGYESEPSFSRAFKRYMRISPGAARRNTADGHSSG